MFTMITNIRDQVGAYWYIHVSHTRELMMHPIQLATVDNKWG